MWRMMMPKARHIVALVILSSLLVAVLYFIERHSDSYAAAERFVSSDTRVTSIVGAVARAEFKFWDGFHAVSSPDGGEANYTFEVTGSNGTAIVEVHLRSASGVWHVITADLRNPGGPATRIVGSASAPPTGTTPS